MSIKSLYLIWSFVSLGIIRPVLKIEICNNPEQSIPKLLLPPHLYGVPSKLSAISTQFL